MTPVPVSPHSAALQGARGRGAQPTPPGSTPSCQDLSRTRQHAEGCRSKSTAWGPLTDAGSPKQRHCTRAMLQDRSARGSECFCQRLPVSGSIFRVAVTAPLACQVLGEPWQQTTFFSYSVKASGQEKRMDLGNWTHNSKSREAMRSLEVLLCHLLTLCL